MYKLTGWKAIDFVRENGGMLNVSGETVCDYRQDVPLAEALVIARSGEPERVSVLVGAPTILHGSEAINYANLHHLRVNCTCYVGDERRQFPVDMLDMPIDYVLANKDKILDIWMMCYPD